MATQIKLTFISDGFRQILLGSGVKDVVQSAADKIQAKANANAGINGESEGFSVDVWEGNYGGGRWIGSVSTTDLESQKAESEDKALSKAVTG